MNRRPTYSKHCVYCRRPEAEVGRLSVRGNCRECGIAAMITALEQQKAKSGPVNERRARRAAEAVQREFAPSRSLHVA